MQAAAQDESSPILTVSPKSPIRVLIVPDKFKGTMPAEQVCAAIAKGWKSARPRDELELLPMSDGGDGFGQVLAQLTKAQTRRVKTVNAAHQPIEADWWWNPSDKLAIVESARVIGLAMLPEKKFHPFQLDTSGLGQILREARRLGAKQCLVGIGGSATNDGGFGLARALGWMFLNQQGQALDHWWQLIQLHQILRPKNPLKLRITVAVDVANPLLGRHGCSRVYGPQKGLKPDDIVHAEKCLRRLSARLRLEHGIDQAATPGAGAAGGLGFGLMAFANARRQNGFDVFAKAAELEKRVRKADLVITGEGALDRQTCMGKGVGQIGLLCRKLRVSCLALAGVMSEPKQVARLFPHFRTLTGVATLDRAKKFPQRYLEKLSAIMAGEY